MSTVSLTLRHRVGYISPMRQDSVPPGPEKPKPEPTPPPPSPTPPPPKPQIGRNHSQDDELIGQHYCAADAASSFWKRGSFRSGSNIGSSRRSAGASAMPGASAPL